jgi:ParB family transcriptional regulator, chromosome partitioning protein
VGTVIDQAGSLELAVIENLVREDLSAIEQTRAVALLLEDLRMTRGVLAKRLGRNRADIVNAVRLLDLPDEALELISSVCSRAASCTTSCPTGPTRLPRRIRDLRPAELVTAGRTPDGKVSLA